MLGPLAITQLRAHSEGVAISRLVKSVDPQDFQKKFSASIEKWPQLVEAKTVGIASLMDIAPHGTEAQWISFELGGIFLALTVSG